MEDVLLRPSGDLCREAEAGGGRDLVDLRLQAAIHLVAELVSHQEEDEGGGEHDRRRDRGRHDQHETGAQAHGSRSA